jgi:hypothetical protein
MSRTVKAIVRINGRETQVEYYLPRMHLWQTIETIKKQVQQDYDLMHYEVSFIRFVD